MIPLYDENPAIRPPIFTVAFMVVCVLVFFYQVGSSAQDAEAFILRFGLIPSVLLGDVRLPPELAGVPASFTVVSSMFLHGGWMHLIGNMLFLWIFGNNIEDVLGHGRFILFYLLSGFGAAALQVWADPASQAPMIGASGAISGVLGAYMILFPRARVLTLVFLGIFITTVRIRALWFLGGWFAMQWFNALASGAAEGGVAWWAHIGGFIAGALALLILKPHKYIFGGGRKGPWG
jgi:rhomboid family protein